VLMVRNGEHVTVEASVNGRARVGLTIWRRGTEETLAVDEIAVAAQKERDALVARLPKDVQADAAKALRDLAVEVLWFRGERSKETSGAVPPPTAPDAAALLATAAPVLDAPAILPLVSDYVKARGYAGDPGPAQVAYLALSSRLLSRPGNLYYTGASAAGKNFTVASVLALFPEDAYYLAHGQSPLAVMYSEESFCHRVLVVAEASAFHEEGIGISLLRGLAWDNELNYDTVIDGKPVHLHKDGPTGLITTGTRDLEPELATRLWSVPIPDDPAHTRQVLRSIALQAAGKRTDPATTPAAFVAAQRWLASAGVREVVVPFAPQLAALVPAYEVRLRRDFTQLVTMIQTHAMLHQRRRQLDAGRVVATFDDYEAVREIVEPMFAMTLSPGLSREMRETVHAVEALVTRPGTPTVTVTEVAAQLKLSDTATWRRVKKALTKRFLVNDESRKGQPAKLRVGTALPVEGRLLPSASDLRANAQTPRASDDPAMGSAFAPPLASGGMADGDEPDPDEEERRGQREGL